MKYIDFSLFTYKRLVTTMQSGCYAFQTFSDFIRSFSERTIILRHDVDLKPQNTLIIAKLENDMGFETTYYFRTIQKMFNLDVIKEVADLNHEIGYHYENMDTCHGDINKAWDDFRSNLEKLRKLYPVKTICMHGSPLSKYDNRDLWRKYDYRTEGIIGEPYLDVDWNEVFYLTDTGRCWDGGNVSIRDNVECKMKNGKSAWPSYHSTKEIINAIKSGTFPQKTMITTHPQRWTNNPILWSKELISQNLKNQVKAIIVKIR